MNVSIEDMYRCLTEYDKERTYAEQWAEGFAEGFAKGFAEGKLAILTSLVKKGLLTLAQAAEEAQMTVAEFEAKTDLMT